MGIEPVRPKAIIFDWDDTLIDNWQAIHTALNLTLVTMGHERWSFEKTKSNVRRSMRDSFPELFGDRWGRQPKFSRRPSNPTTWRPLTY